MSSNRQGTVVTAVRPLTQRPADMKEACLVIIYGPDLGRKYSLNATPVVIGRSSRAGIEIDQESISRSHAEIFPRSGSYAIRDNGSTNGTYVNDKPISERTLRHGDLIKVGRTIFKFLSDDNIESAYHEEIYQLTTIDGLTQIFNRRYFLDALEREMSRAKRYKRDLSLVMFDIDQFKKVNDTHGHLAGDEILRLLAQLVQKRVRREDTLARYGGEEFAIVLPEVNGEGAERMAEKIRKLVEKNAFRFEDIKISLTISAGIAVLGETSATPQEFIAVADAELYRAKSSGRNCVCQAR